jgi:hypothetical protein
VSPSTTVLTTWPNPAQSNLHLDYFLRNILCKFPNVCYCKIWKLSPQKTTQTVATREQEAPPSNCHVQSATSGHGRNDPEICGWSQLRLQGQRDSTSLSQGGWNCSGICGSSYKSNNSTVSLEANRSGKLKRA